ncbi:MAG: isocitrate/isopropylmalate dehydrogenase family protein [Conexivisphaerales archaeon]|jgi:isocitrate dehydrogenase
MAKKVAVIRGDGTGPELVDATMEVFKAVGATDSIEFIPCEGGAEYYHTSHSESYIPQATWDVLAGSDACLKGPTTTEPGPNTPRSVAVSIRQKFDLYANVRPIKTYKGWGGPLGAVDMFFVREGTEGLYSGIEFKLGDDAAAAVRKVTRKSSEKVIRFAFREAANRGWKKVIAINKANILKVTDGLWLEVFRTVGKEFPGIEREEYLVDNFSQQLVKNPQLFNQNVIVGTNLFMDVLTEEASGLIGSIGMVYSANIGDSYAMFEPAHGSSPKYKGLDKVNPVATVLSGAWLLKYLGDAKKGDSIFSAVDSIVSEGKVLTYDLKGTAGTKEMAGAIAKKAAEFLSTS